MVALTARTRITLVAFAALALSTSMHGAQSTEQATRLLADARQALGGDAAISSIHSFTIKGAIATGPRARVLRSRGSFEIACELPDRFVRRETGIASGLLPGADNSSPLDGPTETTVLGFNGDRLVYEPRWTLLDVAAQPQRFRLVETSTQPLLVQAHGDFIRVTLGLFAASFPASPVRFADAPAAASGNAVIVIGDQIEAAMYLDPLTHRPASFGEYRYDDYRNVNGVMLPFRIAQTRIYASTASPVRPTESDDVMVWQVKEFRVNVAIDPKGFKPYPISRR